MINRRSFTNEVLSSVRAMSLEVAVERIGFYRALDRSFVPAKDEATQRWVVSGPQGEWELLVTGPKWYDVRVGKGGGGAIDLAMHLTGRSFVDVVKTLGGG